MIVDLENLIKTQRNWELLKEVLQKMSMDLEEQRNDRYAYDAILSIMYEMEENVKNRGLIK